MDEHACARCQRVGEAGVIDVRVREHQRVDIAADVSQLREIAHERLAIPGKSGDHGGQPAALLG